MVYLRFFGEGSLWQDRALALSACHDSHTRQQSTQSIRTRHFGHSAPLLLQLHQPQRGDSRQPQAAQGGTSLIFTATR